MAGLDAAEVREAVLGYAALGWRVLPVRPRTKQPIIKSWVEKATTDEAVITEWWARWPQANIAVATGAGSAIVVVDIDGAEGERSLVALERRHGPMPEMFPQQWSGSGAGWHAFLRWPTGRSIRNSASKLGPGIDIRGEGGAVMLAPSLHPSGNRYRWAKDRAPHLIPPEPAPAWLLALLDPPAKPAEPFRPASFRADDRAERYALKALESELALVAIAPGGRRNETLNRSAHALFRFVSERKLPADTIARGLLAAAAHAGLPEPEALLTIQSAARARGIEL